MASAAGASASSRLRAFGPLVVLNLDHHREEVAEVAAVQLENVVVLNPVIFDLDTAVALLTTPDAREETHMALMEMSGPAT